MADDSDRAQWGTKLGFVLTGVGAAVGLGNIWRFPQLTSQHGGAGFVLVYIVMVALIGLPLLWAELAVGQRAQAGPVQAFGDLGGPRWRALGILLVGVVVVFMGYYTALAGMVLRYALSAPTEAIVEDPATFLAAASEGTGTLVFLAVFMALTVTILGFGVTRGLERANLIMMPGLFLLIAGLAVYALFQPNAAEGVRFYLSPDWGAIDLGTVNAALNQAFFSVGIGFGMMLTFASYVRRRGSMLPSAATIAGSDLLVALTAGFMVFPLVFSQGLESAVVNEDASFTTALFLTLPSAFAAIGGVLGKVLMLVFFVMLCFAALSSTLGALEVIVAYVQDQWGVPRWKAAVVSGQVTYGLGIAAAFSVDLASRVDAFLANFMLFFAAILLCLFYGLALRKRSRDILLDDDDRPSVERAARIAAPLLSYVIPAVLTIVLLINLPSSWEAVFG